MIEGTSQNQAKGRNLAFDMSGEGNLPRISILKPSIRNKKGLPLLLFRRNLINTVQALPIEICNDGTLPSKVRYLLNYIMTFVSFIKTSTNKCLIFKYVNRLILT